MNGLYEVGDKVMLQSYEYLLENFSREHIQETNAYGIGRNHFDDNQGKVFEITMARKENLTYFLSELPFIFSHELIRRAETYTVELL